jgi:hypothetical protein
MSAEFFFLAGLIILSLFSSFGIFIMMLLGLFFSGHVYLEFEMSPVHMMHR